MQLVMQLDDILRGLAFIRRGREDYYSILDVRNALIQEDITELAVGDGVCTTPFCLAPKGTYELHWYEFNLSVVPDVESAEERLRISDSRHPSDWLKRSRQFTPKFVEEGTAGFPKQWLLDWIDYVLSEPDVMSECRSVFEGEKISDANLFVAFY